MIMIDGGLVAVMMIDGDGGLVAVVLMMVMVDWLW